MSTDSRFKATKIIGQRKAFYRQRIQESSCARKETVDVDILVTFTVAPPPFPNFRGGLKTSDQNNWWGPEQKIKFGSGS